MKTLKIIILLFAVGTNSYGQDGSDIRYFKTYEIDRSLVRQYIHFDFFNRSFGGRSADTVVITINDKPTGFSEIRNDDGFNNWFSQQSLQSIGNVDGQKIRIPKFKLDSITATSFQVTMYIEFYDNNKLLNDKSQQLKYRFDKKDIAEVLIKSKQL